MKFRGLVTILLGLVLSFTPNLFGQNQDDPGHKYVFTAPGKITGESMATLHVGGGAQTPTYRGFGVGVELGYLAPMNYLADGFGVFSADGLYLFGNSARSNKAIPLVFQTNGSS